MFSAGHLIWIGISFILIAAGFAVSMKKRPDIDKVLKICVVIGFVSEIVKILSVANILPMVEEAFRLTDGGVVREYAATGQYSPYIELAHLPFELCSLQIVFMVSALLSRSEKWKHRFLAIIYATGILGGLLGIVMAYLTKDYNTVASYFASPRAWQYFLYHAMVVYLGLYIGFGCGIRFTRKSLKGVLAALVSLDFLSFYINALCSQPVYTGGDPVGLVYRTNFLSSYVNPLGLALSEKWQWLLYLLIRAVLALGLIGILFLLQRRVTRKEGAGSNGPGEGEAG